MFFIGRGKVDVLQYDAKARADVVLTSLEQGDFFAVLALFKDNAVKRKVFIV